MHKFNITFAFIICLQLPFAAKAQNMEGDWGVKKIRFLPQSVQSFDNTTANKSTSISKEQQATSSLLDIAFRYALNEQYKEDGYFKVDSTNQFTTNLFGVIKRGIVIYDIDKKVMTFYDGNTHTELKVKRINNNKIVFAKNQHDFKKLILIKR